jgi:signal peptidase II
MPRLWFWLPAFLSLAGDLFSKDLIFHALFPVSRQRVELLGSWLVLSLQVNTGGVFGILPGRGHFFVILSVAALGVVAWMLKQMEPGQRLLPLALGLVVGGALGNLYDRLLMGCVRDFIFLEAIQYPAFNLADSCICIAAGLLVLVVLREGGPEAAQGACRRKAAR